MCMQALASHMHVQALAPLITGCSVEWPCTPGSPARCLTLSPCVVSSARGVTSSTDCTSSEALACGARCTQCSVAGASGSLGLQLTSAVDANGGSCDGCAVCLPYAACTLGAGEGDVKEVKVAMVASGDVSTYDETLKTRLKTDFASAVGVAASAVSLTVSAASVNLEFTIATTSAAQAAQIRTTVQTAMADTTTASSALGLTIEQAATVTLSTSGGGNDNTALIIGICAGVGGLLLLIIMAFVVMKRSNKTKTTYPSS